jgi:hypothetical protein
MLELVRSVLQIQERIVDRDHSRIKFGSTQYQAADTAESIDTDSGLP